MTLVGPPWRGLLRHTAGYMAATVLVAFSFVLLHHIGNQTPFAVVAEKLAAEFEAEPLAWGTRQRDIEYAPWEYCYISGAVLAGSVPSTTALDALFPPALGRDRTQVFTSDGGYCRSLQRALDDVAAGRNATANAERHEHMWIRQWFGSKALYAIGLRFLTVHEYHEFIRKATYCAYAALGVAIALLGWRTLVVVSPLLIFGATLSGVEQLSGVAKGTPYAWAIFSATLVALLLRCRSVPASATRLFCYVAGMVSAYLWLFDGANFVAAVLIGLVAWCRFAPLAIATRAVRSAACVFAHASGLVVGMTLSPIARGRDPASALSTFASVMPRILAPRENDPLGPLERNIGMWMELLPLSVPAADVLIAATAVALGAALLIAGIRARRRDWGPAQEMLWIGVLGLAPLAHFVLPNDLPYVSARLVYLPLALCWSVLAAVLLRTSRPIVPVFAVLTLGGALLGSWFVWQHAATTVLVHTLDSPPPPPPPMRAYAPLRMTISIFT